MKLVSFIYNNSENIGVMSKNEEVIYPIESYQFINKYRSMNELIENITDEEMVILKSENKFSNNGLKISDVKLLAPITHTKHDIICLGENYKDHQAEMAKASDVVRKNTNVCYFSKRTNFINATHDIVDGKFEINNSLDYECELAIIIGKTGTNIDKSDAENYIFGYSIFNDLTSRNLQMQHFQWFRGKSLDGFAVMGPSIVTKDDLPLPLNLNVQCSVNGELRQNSNTSKFIMDIPSIISEISNGITLYPGDIILTGTPAGVGIGFDPPKYLKSNDTIKCEISGIGELYTIIK